MLFKLFLPVTLLAVFISQSLLFGGTTNDHAPAWSPAGDRIAFLRDEGGGQGIYRVNVDGSNPIHLMTNSLATSPVWSPDGNRIAYLEREQETGEYSIHVMNADGSQDRAITGFGFGAPVWSPDSSKIAAWNNGDLVIIDPDSTNSTILARGRASWLLAWSPDGSKIAFIRSAANVPVYRTIDLVDANGGEARMLIEQPDISSVAWSPDGNKIAFTYRYGYHEIGAINVDGSGFTRLTYDELPKYEIAWSPDSSQIAYRYADANYDDDIYVMKADGSQPRKLTDSNGNESSPVWSPDGSKIAFFGSRIDGTAEKTEVFVIANDGSNLTRITPAHMEPDGFAWSPDSRQITLHGTYAPRSVLHWMNPDGSNVTRLSAEHYVESFAWSPNGEKIAFLSEELYVLDANSAASTKLSQDITVSSYAWSPDSTKIAYASDGIYRVNADGSDLKKLTNFRLGHASTFSWSPDGKKIAFSSGSVHIMDADSGNLTRLLDGSDHGQPVWSPDGRRIAFMDYARLNVINADGSNRRTLGSEQATYPGITPVWSPDGSKIIYSNAGSWNPLEDSAGMSTTAHLANAGTPKASPGHTMYVINADGTDQQILLGYDDNSYIPVVLLPVWSPDSRFIVAGASGTLYLYNADGSYVRLLTLPDYRDSSPTWAPDGRRLVYAANKEGNSDLHLVNINH